MEYISYSGPPFDGLPREIWSMDSSKWMLRRTLMEAWYARKGVNI